MPRYSFAVSAETIDELYASVAAFLDRPTIAVGTALPAAVNVTMSDPANTDDDGPSTGTPPDFDKAGTPWDSRIHASSKAINEDGTWRKRRNLSDVIYASVMAELTASGQTPGSPPASAPQVPVPPAPAAPVGIVDQGSVVIPPPAVVPAPPMAAPVPTVPAVPVAPVAAVPAVPPATEAPVPAAPVAPPVAAGMSFAVLMPMVSDAIKAGRFTDAALKSWVQQWGMDAITQLQADPAKAEQFYQWMRSGGMLD